MPKRLKLVVEQWVLFIVRRQTWQVRRFKIFKLARHFRIESGRPIRIESRSFAGPYSEISGLFINQFLLLFVADKWCSADRCLWLINSCVKSWRKSCMRGWHFWFSAAAAAAAAWRCSQWTSASLCWWCTRWRRQFSILKTKVPHGAATWRI